MTDAPTSPENLERFAAGEGEHLPPAPEGAPAGPDDAEEVFTPPPGNTPYAARTTVDDNRTPEDESAIDPSWTRE
ncbi:hypothetical protein BKA24_002178 [Microbacterium marinum]|jgi:hypothetical protein|uniref:Uncharacterized protein n=1 Tax=Microbacterium marinum TaxID=421115 RepID=A0A7W7BRF4_9MICO|nr:hypothetical protein [Microbacterium marinum]MBB4667469.1 hypothetical protein [Microbacterium marinum]